MITATPGVIIAGAASALPVAKAVHTLHTSGGGYQLPAAILAGAATGPILLAWLPARTCRPIVAAAAFGRRGLADFAHASITALPAPLCYRG